MLSCISIEIDSLSELKILATFYLLIWSLLISRLKITSDKSAVFKVPSRQWDHRLIVFRKVKDNSVKTKTARAMTKYHLNYIIMDKIHSKWWERWATTWTESKGLNFNKGRRMRSFISKGKNPDYYYKTWRGLGYVSTPSITEPKWEEIAQTGGDSDNQAGTPMWVPVKRSKLW